MNQHIMLPNSTLKLFASYGELHYLDVNSNTIKFGRAGSYNTVKDYYPAETEKYLANTIETKIGLLRKTLLEFESKKTKLLIPPELTQLIIRIFVVQCLRIPDFAECVHANSIFAKPLNLPVDFYSVLHKNPSQRDFLIKSLCEHRSDNILKEYSSNIIEIPGDNRDRSLLLTSSHFTILKRWLILILNPYLGIVLLPSSENESMKIGELQQYLGAPNDRSVDLVNESMLEHECTLRSTPKLIGLLPELERMQQYIRELPSISV